MKRIFLFTLFLLSQLSSIQAYDVEARVAYFYPTDNRMRNVYSKSGFVEYELEVSNPLNCFFNCFDECWDGFANVSFYQKNGRSSCLNNRSKVTNWAFNVGGKRFFSCFKCFRPYLGIGAGFAHVSFHDDSPYVKEHINSWGPSLLLKSGLIYDISCNFYLDLFADYGFNWFWPSVNNCCCTGRNIDTGGLKIGAGIGYKF